MRRIRFLLILLCMSILVAGCSRPTPPEDMYDDVNNPVVDPNNTLTEPENYTSTPDDSPNVETNLDVVPTQQAETQPGELPIDIRYLNDLDPVIFDMYWHYGKPVFYPVNEDTLNEFRAWIEQINNDYKTIKFDVYSIEPCVYGFSVASTSWSDPRGYPYFLWFEVTSESDMTPQITVVSCGEDHDLIYQGRGVDYSETGFGDDIVKFVNLSY